jgi:hypothetical protein
MDVFDATTLQRIGNRIELPYSGYSSLVINDELLVGGFYFINVYSLPSLSVSSFKLDFVVDGMISIDNDYLLAKY